MSVEEKPVLNLQAVSHSFVRDRVLADVNMVINRKEVWCLFGASGCGKSTLLKIVAGILTPSSGSVFLNGVDATFRSPSTREVGFVFQGAGGLFPHMTVAENVAYPFKYGSRRIANTDWSKEVNRMLYDVGLQAYATKYPDQLSGGQLQRLALARSLVYRPALLLLDEPVSALDNHLREEILALIIDLQRRFEMTVLCVTHDQRDILTLATHCAMLSNHSIARSGRLEQVIRDPQSREVAELLGNWNIVPIRQKNGHPRISGLRGANVATLEASLAPQSGFFGFPISATTVRHLSDSTRDDEVAFSGTITLKRPRSNGWHYFVNIAGDGSSRPVIATMPSDEGFEEGSEIQLIVQRDVSKILK